MRIINRIKEAYAWRANVVRHHAILAYARVYRRLLQKTVFVGITGSAGKTTTKDLTFAILSRYGATSGTSASLNYLLDVALIVIATKRKDRFSVVEIACDKPGSLDNKVALVRPSLAAMTVVQRDHIKNFDSVESIAKEKSKLILSLPEHGTAVLNMDDPLIRQVGEKTRARRLWFGTSPESDLRLIECASIYPDPLTLTIEYRGQQYTCSTALHGTHLSVPVLASIGLGLAAGVPIEECILALKSIRTTPGRMQVVGGADGVTFIREDYKAPYWTYQVAMDHLAAARAVRKVAVIGTLSDYSLSASKLYPKAARQAMAAADLVVFVGPHALRALKARANDDDRSLRGFTEIAEAHEFLVKELREGDLVLLKGSNRADHLIRLILARSRPVTCWVRGCGYNRFCDACPKLERPITASTHSASPQAGAHGNPKLARERGAISATSTAPTDAWLVVGMGNDGEDFLGTRHNMGFEAVDRLAVKLGLDWAADDEGALCQGTIGGHHVALFKPATLINDSGPAIDGVRRRYGFSISKLIIIHDDVDLPLGRTRLKYSGSDGGHKGLRSVFSSLGNDGFMPRIRIGVRSKDVTGKSTKSLVFERFADKDQPVVQAGLEKSIDLIKEVIGLTR